MDDDSRIGSLVKWGFGALGLGAIVAAFSVPGYGTWIAVAIVVLAVLLFGGYFLWSRLRGRRRRELFTSAIEAQTSAAPKSISDPNARAKLDQLRQKFQKGLHEFKSRGKDLYKLPWYVIIGEPGSGKTEALRHSGIEFPPGLQDELQGSGGTVNMDWWFTNRAIILDTAGSMIFNEARAAEAPEWREFLRLLSKARPECPVNGLFLVLSIESLIRDSSETISQKASRLAQQLDLIQRTLDVRFPVYLLVTKCDLLTGFREFFDGIDDPLLQHQMFGWSNPAALDDHFRPDMVEQHLLSISERLRRRRMALLRDTSPGGRLGDTTHFFASSYQLGRGPSVGRRLDEVDALFALPESLMRLAPRLRRYLETIFVAGEWSAKPVFLRGIYFTTSMREGKALDEAIALATGLALDQLPEDRNWEKSRAFFLRDLFHEKIFRESGLVTRATNTLQLLRQRQIAIFGSAGAALLLLLGFSWYGKSNLNESVGKEATYWRAATNNWKQGVWWNGSIVRQDNNDPFRFAYSGTNIVEGTTNSVVDYHRNLKSVVGRNLAGGLIFKPISWLGKNVNSTRIGAQRQLFEAGVLRPLVRGTQGKMQNIEPADSAALARHKEAWLALLRLERDGIDPRAPDSFTATPVTADKNLKAFVNYLTEADQARSDTNIVDAFLATFSPERSKAQWPPKGLLGGNSLASNPALANGLEKFHLSSLRAQTNIDFQLALLTDLSDRLNDYYQKETPWLANSADACGVLSRTLLPLKSSADASLSKLRSLTNFVTSPLTNLTSLYGRLEANAAEASSKALVRDVQYISLQLSLTAKNRGLIPEIEDRLRQLASQAGSSVRSNLNLRARAVAELDTNCIAAGSSPAYQLRWRIYTNACALANTPTTVSDGDLGDEWKQFSRLKTLVDQFRVSLANYTGPLAALTAKACNDIAQEASEHLEARYVSNYLQFAERKLDNCALHSPWAAGDLASCRTLFEKIDRDSGSTNAPANQQANLATLRNVVADSKKKLLLGMDRHLKAIVKFPVLLNRASDEPMSLQQLKDLRLVLDDLKTELQNPMWKSDSSGSIDILQKSCSRYASIVTLLTREDGKPADWEIRFVGTKAGSDERQIVGYFRQVSVSLEETKSEPDLSRIFAPDTVSLGKGRIDRGVAISFKKNDNAAPVGPKPFADWGLLRLICDAKARRSEDGFAWRIPIQLKHPETNKGGDAVFEVRPVSDSPKLLPKSEDWWQ